MLFSNEIGDFPQSRNVLFLGTCLVAEHVDSHNNNSNFFSCQKKMEQSKNLKSRWTEEDYDSVYWPLLRSTLDTVLLEPPGSYKPISYEQVSRDFCVTSAHI